MKLIEATIQDVPMLLEIEKTARGLKIYSGCFTEQEIEEWLGNDIVFLIENDDLIVGSLSYEIKDKNHARISGFVIKPKFQKQGFAKQALKLLFQKLNNFRKLSLDVHPDNHIVGLYESLGFKRQSLVEDYYGDGEPRLVMVKNNAV
jgi:ribosomal-protein-alanine N-acetyltransferase